MRRGAFFGLLLVVLGTIFLLAQTQILHIPHRWLTFSTLWPLIFVFIGVSGLREFRKRRIPWWSLFFIVYGAALIMQATERFAWLNHVNGWALFFSLVVITVGAQMVTPVRKRGAFPNVIVSVGDSSRSKQSGRKASLRASKGDKRGGHLLGDLNMGMQPWVLEDLELWNGIGDVRLNLATATMEDREYTIYIGGWIGDVRILVPDDLPVAVTTDVRVGDIEVLGESLSGTNQSFHREDVLFASSPRRCQIQVRLGVGDVEIVRV